MCLVKIGVKCAICIQFMCVFVAVIKNKQSVHMQYVLLHKEIVNIGTVTGMKHNPTGALDKGLMTKNNTK